MAHSSRDGRPRGKLVWPGRGANRVLIRFVSLLAHRSPCWSLSFAVMPLHRERGGQDSHHLPPERGLTIKRRLWSSTRGRLLLEGSSLRPATMPSQGTLLGLREQDGSRSRGGMDANVNSLLVHGLDLYAAGAFTEAGVTPAAYVARWRSGTWYPLGTGLNDHALSLGEYQGDVVAGGWFTMAGELSVNHVAAWNGTSWSALGTGLAGDNPNNVRVRAIAEYDGALFVGGHFSQAGSSEVTHLARWDGQDWSNGQLEVQGDGTWSDPVMVLKNGGDGHLIIGGGFAAINGVYCNGLASWNGAVVEPLAVGLSPGAQVLDVTWYNGSLIAFGYLTGPGGSGMVARWTGEWTGLGSGLELANLFGGAGRVAVYNSQLYMGGNIGQAGGAPSTYIARWDDGPSTGAVLGFPSTSAVVEMSILRNPVRLSEQSLLLRSSGATGVSLDLFDVTGRRIHRIMEGTLQPGEHRFSLGDRDSGTRIAGLSGGVYLVRLLTDHSLQSERVVLIR